MKVSVFLGFQGGDWIAQDDSSGKTVIRDGQVYEDNLKIADLLDPLGFDAIFNVEHHGTPHHMTSNPMALLNYMAGRTERLEFGTSVIVLPWSHPVRAAEELCVLDNLARGRHIYIGVGRGSAPGEFVYLNVDQNEARDRFSEGVELLRTALRHETFSHHGKYYNIDNGTVRPRPVAADLGEQLFGAIATRPSLELVAEMGLDLMSTGGASVQKMRDDAKLFNDIRAKSGLPPAKPIIGIPGYCSTNVEDARSKAERCFGNYFDAAMKHYRYDQVETFAKLKGYEHYAAAPPEPLPGEKASSPRDDYIESGIYGTPDQCIERIQRIQAATGTDHILMLTMSGGVSSEDVSRSLTLFAKEVLPVVRAETDSLASV